MRFACTHHALDSSQPAAPLLSIQGPGPLPSIPPLLLHGSLSSLGRSQCPDDLINALPLYLKPMACMLFFILEHACSFFILRRHAMSRGTTNAPALAPRLAPCSWGMHSEHVRTYFVPRLDTLGAGRSGTTGAACLALPARCGEHGPGSGCAHSQQLPVRFLQIDVEAWLYSTL